MTATMKIDIHQHIWTEPLVQALSERRELPFIRSENGLSVLFLAGERPYVIDRDGEAPTWRAELVRRDGIDRALVCLSSPLGIESLPREQAKPLLDAYHDGALALGEPFGVWGAIALDRADPDDVDRVLELGCVGVSLPACAIADLDRLADLTGVLDRLQDRSAPLLIHPGRARSLVGQEASLSDPLWWPSLTRYVAEMQACWLAFLAAGRRSHPELAIVFSMLAGLAPLHHERLRARGGPALAERDPLTFYETSSYGPRALRELEALVGPEQILYGSDRPLAEPEDRVGSAAPLWDAIAERTGSMFVGKAVLA